jgi:hypothetical protein
MFLAMKGSAAIVLFACGMGAGFAGLGCSGGASSAGDAPDASQPHGDATADTGGSSSDAGDAAADGALDAAATCQDMQSCPPSTAAGELCVVSVQAQLVDGTGAAIAGQDLLVCGDNLCSLPGVTDSHGSTSIFLCEQMVVPALKFLGGSSYVSFAAAITEKDTSFAPITLVPLPATGPTFPAGGGKVTSGSVSLDVAANAVTFDSTQADTPNLHVFLAAAVDLTKPPPGFPSSLGLKIVWGLAPVNATLTPSATLTIPNTLSWAAGSKVDFYMNGVEPIAMPVVPYGAWGPVGTGTVSADGTTISTDTGAGNGIPILGMVGVRPHQ